MGVRKFTPGSVNRTVTKTFWLGGKSLTTSWKHLGISLKEAEKHLLPRYNFNDVDELLAAIGGGDIRLNQMGELPAIAI
ncbi:GTP pyrophosphokinase [Escherichia coli]|uniref:GTP pyrophosphokinase n=1 Tax=Escherichia coli TaxID=562 RepID=A0A376KNT0_ECOLX|nr:GTP pyrophosphokinase [Escherichia coli]